MPKKSASSDEDSASSSSGSDSLTGSGSSSGDSSSGSGSGSGSGSDSGSGSGSGSDSGSGSGAAGSVASTSVSKQSSSLSGLSAALGKKSRAGGSVITKSSKTSKAAKRSKVTGFRIGSTAASSRGDGGSEISAVARNAELEEKDADSVVSSVLEKQDASKTKDGEDGEEDKGKADVVANGAGGTDGGGWGIWNAIISKKRSEKGSFLNTALRSFHVFRKSYALILGSMVLVIVALVAVRPSFVLAESTNRFKEPSIDVVRVAVYALAFGAFSYIVASKSSS